MIFEGQSLESLLRAQGVVTGDAWTATWHIDVDRLRALFEDHCVVIRGHLPAHYWPRYKRCSGLPIAGTLCTCQTFGQSAECEHQYFVLGMLARPGERPDLRNTPLIRPMGRKRKADV